MYSELEQTIARAHTQQQEQMKVAETQKKVMVTESSQKASVLQTQV